MRSARLYKGCGNVVLYSFSPRAKHRLFRYNDLIPENPSSHRATYDADGNIVLPKAEAQVMQEGMWYTPKLPPQQNHVATNLHSMEPQNILQKHHFAGAVSEGELDVIAFNLEEIEQTPVKENAEAIATFDIVDDSAISKIESTAKMWQSVREEVFAVTNDIIEESARQYQSSAVDSVRVSRGAVIAIREGSKNLWSFLTQPVWVPGRNNQPKQYGRGALFLLDTVRFGGTFASLFVVLFVGLNFQSFWTVAHSYISPLSDITTGKQLAAQMDNTLMEKLKNIPSLSTAGGNGDLMAYLPNVGPPENRLIIPKMELNVPIVVPPNTNLLNENWKALEEDIQQNLQNGVVHYPGTARPGQAGNFFVTGHSSYFPWAAGDFKSVFARLGELDVGDEYWVYYGGDKYRYIITDKKEINPSDVTALDQPVGKRISSLMTCTPIGTTLRRLIITAQEVDPSTGKPMEVGEHDSNQRQPATKLEMLPI